MKKLILTLVLALFMGAGAIPASAKTTNDPQIRVTIGGQQDHYRRGAYTRTTTRIVRDFYGRTYRETYRVKYLPNGRVKYTLISRVEVPYGYRRGY